MNEALWGYVYSHSRRELRVINGHGHQYLIYCTCPLCVDALAHLGEKDAEYEVVHDSNPPERVVVEEQAAE